MGKLKIVVVEPDKDPEIRIINHTLEEMHRIVGGYIETVKTDLEGVVIVCNESGMIDGLPLNAFNIHGTFFFVAVDVPEFISLNEYQINKVIKQVKWWREKQRQTGIKGF
jgi:Domain of unknown function (DUF3846)